MQTWWEINQRQGDVEEGAPVQTLGTVFGPRIVGVGSVLPVRLRRRKWREGRSVFQEALFLLLGIGLVLGGLKQLSPVTIIQPTRSAVTEGCRRQDGAQGRGSFWTNEPGGRERLSPDDVPAAAPLREREESQGRGASGRR